MRILFLIVISAFSLNDSFFAQNLKTARSLFDNFEYQQAISEYEKFDNLIKLPSEDQENLGFCYYITGNYHKGLPYINSIIQKDDERAYLWLWKGTLEKENGDYEAAIKSFDFFKSLSSELSREVDLLIQSCALIPTWDTIPRSSIQLDSGNCKYADSYSILNDVLITLKETGLDSTGKLIDGVNPDSSFPEVLTMKPYYLNNDKLSMHKLFSEFPGLSINRIQQIPNSSQLIFSASDILNKNEILKTHQIYIAEFNTDNTPIKEIKLWKYSGLSDSGSYSHPALSPDGSKLVFTKSSRHTSGSDLYISEFVNGDWSIPTPLTQLNTPGNEMYPIFQNNSTINLSSDGRIGYGGLDIYNYNIENKQSEEAIIHYHAPINSPLDDFNLTWIDSLNALFVSNRTNGTGDDDIWRMNIEPLPVIIADDGFVEWYERWNLKPVYFDFDSFESELNKDFIEGCKKFFDKYKVEIKLVGHTDARGIPEYNYELGLNRCRWMETQLKNAQILNKITLESVGETQLVNSCDSKSKCSEEEHLKNRFVQIFISFDKNELE